VESATAEVGSHISIPFGSLVNGRSKNGYTREVRDQGPGRASELHIQGACHGQDNSQRIRAKE
jgi:hypothetical protein